MRFDSVNPKLEEEEKNCFDCKNRDSCGRFRFLCESMISGNVPYVIAREWGANPECSSFKRR